MTDTPKSTQISELYHWTELWNFLKKRLKSPIAHPSYIFYFILVVVGVGGIGVWKAAVIDQSVVDTTSNLMTFFPALAGASAFELALNKGIIKAARMLTILVGGILVVAIIVMWNYPDNLLSLFVGLICATVSLTLWWIANADNGKLLEEPPGKEAFGGEVEAATQGQLGEIKG